MPKKSVERRLRHLKIKQLAGEIKEKLSVVKKDDGLSIEDRNKLKELKKSLEGKDPDSKTPDSAQKTITFEKM